MKYIIVYPLSEGVPDASGIILNTSDISSITKTQVLYGDSDSGGIKSISIAENEYERIKRVLDTWTMLI